MPTAAPHWSTAAFSGPAEPAPEELTILTEHLHACRAARRELAALRAWATPVRRFLATRFMTAVVLLALVGIVTVRLV